MANTDNSLSEFLKKEYDNIAAAHFKANETISEFFKNYITIISIPITIFAIVFNLDIVQNSITQTPESLKLPALIVGILFSFIAIAGISIYLHVLNLHFDSILYARTVNGIRKFFFDNDVAIPWNTKHNYRVLPQSTQFPSYRNFGPIV